MLNKLFTKLRKFESQGDFTHANVTDNLLNKAEKNLKITIPTDYKTFLKEFGHGGFGGMEILGVGKNGKTIFESTTSRFRTYGLPHELIVIENCDEWIYCIHSATGKIVSWSKGFGCSDAFDNFLLFLDNRINDALENI